MRPRQPRRVRKRDGREVPFDPAKIESAVRHAQAAVGEEDPLFAREVADVVTLTLATRVRGVALHGTPGTSGTPGASTETSGMPGIEEIQDLVERALIELGAAPVAKAYILYRDRRARTRDGLRSVSRPDSGSIGERGGEAGSGLGVEPSSVPRGLRVRTAEGLGEWSKGRIVAALMNEAELGRGLAEEVAGRVERRVFASGMRRVSTALIREFVAGELAEMGLGKALQRQGLVGLPRHDLCELFERQVGSRTVRESTGDTGHVQPSLREATSGVLLKGHMLEDVLDERSADRILAGELHVEDLSSAHLHLAQSIPADLLLSGEPSSAAAFRALDELALAAGAVSRDLVLEEPGRLFGSGGRSLREESLSSWLVALSAFARGSLLRVSMSGLSVGPSAFLARVIRASAALAEDDVLARPPRLYLDAAELTALAQDDEQRGNLALLLARGIAVPTFSPRAERIVGPGLSRRARERGALGLGAVVALNLPRLARRAGPWREETLLESVAESVGEAVALCARLSTFQRDVHRAREGEFRGRITYAVTVCGLRECLRILGDGELSAELGARLLGLCDEAARRFSVEHRLALSLVPDYGARAAQHFASVDQMRPRADQGLLFPSTSADQFGSAGSKDSVGSYSHGFAIGSAADSEGVEAEALLLSTVPRASLPTVFRTASDPGAALTEWERFEAFRAARHAQLSLESVPTAASDENAPAFDWSEEGDGPSLQSSSSSATLPLSADPSPLS